MQRFLDDLEVFTSEPLLAPMPDTKVGVRKIAELLAWRQIGTLGSLPRMNSALGLLAITACACLLPGPLSGQETWTGIGSIAGTAMFMDTTTIVRAGPVRKVWIRSVDATPKKFVAGKDTLTFDTVVALNVFDCAKETRTVTAVQYEVEGEVVLDVPETHDTPAPVRAGSFFGAVFKGLCQPAR